MSFKYLWSMELCEYLFVLLSPFKRKKCSTYIMVKLMTMKQNILFNFKIMMMILFSQTHFQLIKYFQMVLCLKFWSINIIMIVSLYLIFMDNHIIMDLINLIILKSIRPIMLFLNIQLERFQKRKHKFLS